MLPLVFNCTPNSHICGGGGGGCMEVGGMWWDWLVLVSIVERAQVMRGLDRGDSRI